MHEIEVGHDVRSAAGSESLAAITVGTRGRLVHPHRRIAAGSADFTQGAYWAAPDAEPKDLGIRSGYSRRGTGPSIRPIPKQNG